MLIYTEYEYCLPAVRGPAVAVLALALLYEYEYTVHRMYSVPGMLVCGSVSMLVYGH